MAESEPASEYNRKAEHYRQAVGEYFTGKYIGKSSSEEWYKIEIDEESLTGTMKDALNDIDKCGGFWKGYFRGVLYTACEEEIESLDSKFKITGWGSFPKDEAKWREREKYPDKRGFFFVVEIQ